MTDPDQPPRGSPSPDQADGDPTLEPPHPHTVQQPSHRVVTILAHGLTLAALAALALARQAEPECSPSEPERPKIRAWMSSSERRALGVRVKPGFQGDRERQRRAKQAQHQANRAAARSRASFFDAPPTPFDPGAAFSSPSTTSPDTAPAPTAPSASPSSAPKTEPS